MPNFLAASLTNAVVASLLALAALAVCRAWRNPFVNRGVWLAVLLKFVVPPLVLLPLVKLPAPPANLLTHANQAAQPTVDRPPAIQAAEFPRPRFAELVAAPAEANVETMDATAPTAADSPLPTPPVTTLPRATVESTAPALLAAAPLAAASAPARPGILSVISAFWLGGSAALLVIALHRILRFHAALARSRVASHGWQRRVRRLAAAAGLKRPPLVRLTAGRTPPLAWRLWRRSTIVLPAELVARLPAAEADAILAHEVMHLRRRDDRLRWLELAVVAAWWWCPLAWLARRRLHESEERCCDADALRTFPATAGHYARALLATLDFVAPAPRLALAGAPFMDRGSLVRRFEMITSRRLPAPPTRRARALLLAACGAVLLTTPIARSVEAQPDGAEIQPDQPVTIQLSDGTLAEGRVASIKDGRVLVVIPSATGVESDKADAEKPAKTPAARPVPSLDDDEPQADETADSGDAHLERPVESQPTIQGISPTPFAGLHLSDRPARMYFPDSQETIVGRWYTEGESIKFVPDDPSLGSVRLSADFVPSKEPATTGNAPKPVSSDNHESFRIWDLSLRECLDIGFANNSFLELTRQDDGSAVIAHRKNLKGGVEPLSDHVADTIVEVGDVYWELQFAYRDLDARKIARDHALATWRQVKTLQRSGAVGGEDDKEAQVRAQYYQRRAAVETALSELFHVENRLRNSLGLATKDGRLIRPIDEPGKSPPSFDWESSLAAAKASRPELVRQRIAIAQRKQELADAQQELISDGAGMTDLQRRQRIAFVRHCELLLERDQTVLKDLELEVSHQVGDALRGAMTHRSMLETNANRRVAASDEVEAVETLYKVGQIDLDRVLDAQARLADAIAAFYRSAVDFERANLKFEFRKGATLERFGYRVK